jgi:uncharacterized membrane protein YkvA (DUF1232 family)
VASSIGTSVIRRAVRQAVAIVTGKRPLGRLLAAAVALLGRNPVALRAVRADAAAIVRMAREVLARRYRQAPKRTLVAALAALVYLVNPLDLLPDLLPVLGWLDDAVVFTWVARQIRRDIDAFLVWEREWGGAIDVEGTEVSQPALPGGSEGE